MKRVTLYFMIAALGVLPLLVGQACQDSGSFKASSKTEASSIDLGLVSEKPILDCSVINLANNSVITKITDLTSSTSYPLNPPTAPLNARIDCSKSSSVLGGNLSFVFKDGAATLASSGANAQISFSTPRVAAINVEIRDSKTTAVNNKSFNLAVACNASSYPALTVNASALQITAAAQPGYVNINFAGVASGGTGSYAYAIDLNGDGRFDNYNRALYVAVNSFSNMYTLFSGVRNVGIRVLDTSCQLMASSTKSVDFRTILPAPEAGAMATQKNYYYVQGNVNRLTSGDADSANQVQPFQAVEAAPVSGTPKHVTCSYNKSALSGPGTFSIKGLNAYEDGVGGTAVNPALVQGMKLKVTDIVDAGGAGPYEAAATMETISYQSAASQDGGPNQYIFNKTQNCTVTTRITRETAAVPCQSGQGFSSPTVTILGVYSCPLLHADNPVPDDNFSAGKNISITNGYFYCQVAPVDNCVGGGGGGGGGEPPPVF